MRKSAIQHSQKKEDGLVSKDWFLSMMAMNTGQRMKVLEEYYKIILNFGVIEEEKAGKTYFKAVETA